MLPIIIPKCKVCGNACSWRKQKKVFSLWCSVSCRNKDPDRRSKISNANKANADKRKTKAMQTNRAKYGADWPMQCAETQFKQRSTTNERYGVDNVSQNADIKARKASTTLKHYGVDHNLKSAGIRDCIKQTNIRKYGYEYPTQSKEVINTRQINNFYKYGVTNPSKLDAVKGKSKNTSMDRYGVSSYSQTIEGKQRFIDRMKSVYGNQFNSTLYKAVEEANGGIHPVQLCERPHCTISKAEYEIADFLEGRSVTVEQSNRTILGGKEIDIYIPSKHIGIEFNGVHWHKDDGSRDKYHLYNKMLLANSKGIQLINIWDFEWSDRKYQVKNLIISKLTAPDRRIQARKCAFVKLDGITAKMFINANHIQPIIQSPAYAYGLIYEGQLVAVMAFRLHHRTSNTMVLSRYCCVSGVQIIGGAGKLLKHAIDINAWGDIISWSDNRWSDGGLYRALGFKLQHNLRPDYRYASYSGKIIEKQACTKKKLGARPNQTEYERATEMGLTRFWDCGKMTWILTS